MRRSRRLGSRDCVLWSSPETWFASLFEAETEDLFSISLRRVDREMISGFESLFVAVGRLSSGITTFFGPPTTTFLPAGGSTKKLLSLLARGGPASEASLWGSSSCRLLKRSLLSTLGKVFLRKSERLSSNVCFSVMLFL